MLALVTPIRLLQQCCFHHYELYHPQPTVESASLQVQSRSSHQNQLASTPVKGYTSDGFFASGPLVAARPQAGRHPGRPSASGSAETSSP